MKTKVPLLSKNKFGFRFSLVDAAVLSLAGVVAYWEPFVLHPAAVQEFFRVFILYVVASFFLFCNVFRVRTKYELRWVLSLGVNAGVSLWYCQSIYAFFAVQSACTLVAIGCEIRSANYHGIFCKERAAHD